ncbi:MAG: hypothetical protein ACK559_34875, partial [bacterium]
REAERPHRALVLPAKLYPAQPHGPPERPEHSEEDGHAGEDALRDRLVQIERGYPSRFTTSPSRATRTRVGACPAQCSASASRSASVASGAWWKRYSSFTAAASHNATAYSGYECPHVIFSRYSPYVN